MRKVLFAISLISSPLLVTLWLHPYLVNLTTLKGNPIEMLEWETAVRERSDTASSDVLRLEAAVASEPYNEFTDSLNAEESDTSLSVERDAYISEFRTYVDRALAKNPTLPAHIYLQAKLLYLTGYHSDAKEVAQSVLRVMPSHKAAQALVKVLNEEPLNSAHSGDIAVDIAESEDRLNALQPLLPLAPLAGLDEGESEPEPEKQASTINPYQITQEALTQRFFVEGKPPVEPESSQYERKRLALAWDYYSAEDYDNASEQFERIIQDAETSPIAKTEYVEFLLLSQKIEEAMGMLERDPEVAQQTVRGKILDEGINRLKGMDPQSRAFVDTRFQLLESLSAWGLLLTNRRGPSEE